jgi:hypothetical protein
MIKLNVFFVFLVIFISGCERGDMPAESVNDEIVWRVGEPVFTASEGGGFDNTSVKDPSIVYYNGKWHLFYTGFGDGGQLHIGYVNASKLDKLNDGKRTMLAFENEDNPNNYYAAPDVFYFEPDKKWYLVFQGYWNDVQPLYSTTDDIEDPGSWTQPKDLMPKFEGNSWVDFYVICDDEYAYLTYSRNYNSVYYVKTRLEDFPAGFDHENAQVMVEDDYVEFGEAAHIYKAKGLGEYHMIYEISDLRKNRMRYYVLYSSEEIGGPWELKYPVYAAKHSLGFGHKSSDWPEEVSHGEMIRTNYNQCPEYDPVNVRFLMQGILSKERGEKYDPSKYWTLPWKLGILETKLKN